MQQHLTKAKGRLSAWSGESFRVVLRRVFSVSEVHLQAVEGLSQVTHTAPLSRSIFWGVLTPQAPWLDSRPETGTRVCSGSTNLW